MARWLWTVLVALSLQLSAQQEQYRQPQEEDEAYKQREYAFNPLQAEQEFRVGEFYYRKGSWKAAVGRYEEAVKWNPRFAEAWWKLALAYEKLAGEQAQAEASRKYLEAARQALEKFLELNPKGKQASEALRRLERLKSEHR